MQCIIITFLSNKSALKWEEKSSQTGNLSVPGQESKRHHRKWERDLQFQGRDHMITDMCDEVEPFQVKLLSWETSDAEPSGRNEILIRHIADRLSTLGSHLRCFSGIEA